MATGVALQEKQGRLRTRVTAVAAAVVLLVGAAWVVVSSFGGPEAYQPCPADVTGFTGSCAVGTDLYRYEDGQVCGEGSLLNGEEHWLDGAPCL